MGSVTKIRTALNPRYCEICGTELSEKKASVGARCQNCALIERTSGRSLEEIREDLVADAPRRFFPEDDLSPAVERYPKIREFFRDEISRTERDPVDLMLRFVDAWKSGTLVATTLEAQRAAAWTAEWYREILQGPDEKGRVERVMGLRGRGKDPALQAARDRFRDEDLFSEMIRLMSLGWGLDVTIDEAAKMVCALCEKLYTAAACTKLKMTPSGKLARRFKRSKIGNGDFVALAAELEPVTLEEAQQLLNKFPQTSLPSRLQNFILRPPSGR
jgi:hypothetical protein